MNNQRINPVSAKLKRGTSHYLDGKEVYIQLDRMDGTICITDDPQLSLGANYWDILKSELKSQPKYNTSLKVVKDKPAKIKEKDEYNEFFKTLYNKVPFNCQSCRRALYALTNTQKKASCAHLLPKAVFKSVATNPDNIVFLGCYVFGASCDCHTIFDKSVEKRMNMPIYEVALKRYELLKPHLTPKEIIMADEYLGITTKSTNLLKDIQGGKHGI